MLHTGVVPFLRHGYEHVPTFVAPCQPDNRQPVGRGDKNTHHLLADTGMVVLELQQKIQGSPAAARAGRPSKAVGSAPALWLGGTWAWRSGGSWRTGLRHEQQQQLSRHTWRRDGFSPLRPSAPRPPPPCPWVQW
jgi:hypothetical protein